LIEEWNDVAVVRAGMPRAIGEIPRLTGKDGGLDMITSKSATGASAERRFEHIAIK
jgi:hypothetical protein